MGIGPNGNRAEWASGRIRVGPNGRSGKGIGRPPSKESFAVPREGAIEVVRLGRAPIPPGMAYANQDFGHAAPPDSGGHLGAKTVPHQLVDPAPPVRRVDPIRTGQRGRTNPVVNMGDKPKALILLAAGALMVAALWRVDPQGGADGESPEGSGKGTSTAMKSR